MSHVFISYKKDDRARVKRLVDALVAEGIDVWWDVHLDGGASWREEIQAKLDAAACAIVVWSAGSVGREGHFVQDEASRANHRGVYLPVAIDPVEPPLGFGHKQVIDLVGWRGARRDHRFVELVEAVRRTISAGPAASAPAAAPRRSERHWRRHAALVAIGLTLLFIAAALLGGRQICGALGLPCGGPMFAARAPSNSIAVLPFANLSGDSSQDYFSDGLSEELLSRLARIPQLRVAARTSSFKFRDTKADSRAIAAKLGVAYILDGSVRRDGHLIRVTAQLVEARTGFETWSQTYERDFKDIFAVQSGIAEAVAQALSVRLAGVDRAVLDRGASTNPQAYDDYLRGLDLFRADASEAGRRDALAKFDAAIAADPRFAAAHAMRARTLLAIARRFAPAGDLPATYEEAIASARRAVELAPRLADAQATLAGALLYGARDVRAARLAYEQALAVGGAGNAEVLLRYGVFQCQIGNSQAGLAALRHAVALDPLNERAFNALGQGLLYANQYEGAIVAMHRAIELSPASNGARAMTGEALLLLGRPAEAQSEYELESEGWQRLTGQAIVLRRLGDEAGARAALKALIAAEGPASAYDAAQVYAQWGDADAAFTSLDTAFKVGDSGVELLKADPLMTPLRRDPRFLQALARAGLGD